MDERSARIGTIVIASCRCLSDILYRLRISTVTVPVDQSLPRLEVGQMAGWDVRCRRFRSLANAVNYSRTGTPPGRPGGKAPKRGSGLLKPLVKGGEGRWQSKHASPSGVCSVPDPETQEKKCNDDSTRWSGSRRNLNDRQSDHSFCLPPNGIVPLVQAASTRKRRPQ